MSDPVEERDFWVIDTTPIAGAYKGAGRPFFWFAETPSSLTGHEKYELDLIEREFGFRPSTCLGLGAMCNDRVDHRILGELCLAISSRCRGVIDFQGWLRLPASMRPEGRLRSMAIEPGEPPHTHIADARFLKAWLGHDRFHMIK